MGGVGRGVVALLKILSLVSYKPLRRLPGALQQDTVRRLVWLPAALCVLVAIMLVALAGFVLACLRPGSIVEPGAARLAAE